MISRDAKRIAKRSPIRLQMALAKWMQQRGASLTWTAKYIWFSTDGEIRKRSRMASLHEDLLASRVKNQVAMLSRDRVAARLETRCNSGVQARSETRIDSGVVLRTNSWLGWPIATGVTGWLCMPKAMRINKRAMTPLAKDS